MTNVMVMSVVLPHINSILYLILTKLSTFVILIFNQTDFCNFVITKTFKYEVELCIKTMRSYKYELLYLELGAMKTTS